MNVSKAKELFLSLTKEHFASSTVIFANQSRTAKPNIPLVTLLFGTASTHRSPNEMFDHELIDGYYLTKIPITVDLFTNGSPVMDNGVEIARENTALDEMLLFRNFLNSQYVTEWCNTNDVSIVLDGNTEDLTGLVNDTTYEFRSRLSVSFYFTQNTVGDKAAQPVETQTNE